VRITTQFLKVEHISADVYSCLDNTATECSRIPLTAKFDVL